jgi:hypothetical protein
MIYRTVFLGQNKKRKRGDFEVEELDEASKRKLRRLEERQNMMMEGESSD